MNAVDIGPIAPADRRQPALDLFLIFACANIVATTFQTGASLVPSFSFYMSSLALRSLVPKAGDQVSVWSTGLIAAALSLFSGAWLDRYASFMLVLGGILVPVGGILFARFYLLRTPVRVKALYESSGEFSRHGGFDVAGLVAWGAGGAAYYLARSIGGTMPSLAVAVGVYLGLKRLTES